MIDTADLQAFLAKIEGGAVAVDLLKIGENNHQQYANVGKFCIFVVFILNCKKCLISIIHTDLCVKFPNL